MLRRRIWVWCVLCAAACAQSTLPEQTLGGVTIREQWVPMRDGVKLAANLFFPADLQPSEKIPALLEYLPYRKDDWSLGRDYSLHSYFVKHRYVVARVDIRGTGRSEGATPDREYSEQEMRDGEDVIAWLARQPWSNGSVGMLGISWGGFNAIQMAMRHPPALKAILAADASDNLFHDDIHYIDGMMHVDEFEISMDLTNALSPAPDFPTDDKTLAAHFDTPPWFLLYLKHQRNSEFWWRNSLSSNYGRIKIPVFLIGGFLDGYRDSVPRMLENLSVPRTAIMGPWPHSFPHDADPGPDVEWRDLATAWWDHWLKGEKNDVESWPMLRVYLRDGYEPSLAIKEIPGEWKATNWPADGTFDAQYYLSDAQLVTSAPDQQSRKVLQYAPSAGVQAGFWWGDLTPDQAPLDDKSLVFDSDPLPRDEAILGRPLVSMYAESSAPMADWFVRLEDVAPDGSKQLVTGGGLSVAQRNSSAFPQPVVIGRYELLEVPMHFTSWTFAAGHRIRVSVSNALWPMIWPTPFAMTTDVLTGDATSSMLILPVVYPRLMPDVQFATPAETATMPGIHSEGDLLPGSWTETHDGAQYTTTINWHGEEHDFFPWGEETTHERLVHTVHDDRPAEAVVHGEASMEVKLKDRTLLWSTTLDLRSDAHNFYYSYTRELHSGGKLMRRKTWHETIPRDYQ
ncbi:MAG TPA: CocE/NonD family hydrolase [Candidatus Koribacter sp.]